jgi:C-terminal processing protease CtpA/Prc
MKPILRLGWAAAPAGETAILNLGGRNPIFALPANFQRRRGLQAADEFLTGSFEAGGRRIGFIRIPTMSPVNALNTAYQIFEEEVAWMQANTDGLIVDVMRNTGGFIIYGHELARRLIPYPFEGVGFELRATQSRVNSVWNEWQNARNTNAPGWAQQLWGYIFQDVQTAFRENRGRTGPLPLNMPSLGLVPASVVYTKPLICLIDEFSFSTGDLFPALLQDARRGLLVGMRSGGGGGTNGSFNTGFYSEGSAGVLFGLMVRPNEVQYEGFPATRYIENVGVRPDIELDYMTRDNLLQSGRPFFNRVLEIMQERINAGR